MILYMSGCVTMGSSCSLWPSFLKHTMSTTTSFLNFIRKSSANSVASSTASGSSPFTWRIGASTIFATSVQ